jgi:hypothetical protein
MVRLSLPRRQPWDSEFPTPPRFRASPSARAASSATHRPPRRSCGRSRGPTVRRPARLREAPSSSRNPIRSASTTPPWRPLVSPGAITFGSYVVVRNWKDYWETLSSPRAPALRRRGLAPPSPSGRSHLIPWFGPACGLAAPCNTSPQVRGVHTPKQSRAEATRPPESGRQPVISGLPQADFVFLKLQFYGSAGQAAGEPVSAKPTFFPLRTIGETVGVQNLRNLMTAIESNRLMGSRLLMVLILATSSLPAASSACSCSTGSLPRFSVAETVRELATKKWPGPPPGARIEGYALFEIVVSPAGKVCCVTAVVGHPLLVSALMPMIEQWSFKSGRAFIGVIATRYSSSGYQLL